MSAAPPQDRACPSCDSRDPRLKSHDNCLTDERVGWMLHPFPPVFWRRVSVQALSPIVAYVGPLPQRDSETLRIHEFVTDDVAFVYAICDADFATLYVGKTINPTGRLNNHRRHKDWWPKGGHLALLAVGGANRAASDSAALHLEAIAIRDLRPRHNIAGVS